MINLEKEKERMKSILDNMSIEEFDNMLVKCGINELKTTRTKCYHNNIVVAHNNISKIPSINCVVRCRDCDETLYQSFNKKVEEGYDYIRNNKSHFETLIDLTGDNLNELLGIADGLWE